MPRIEILHHVTPSPYNELGVKGVDEAGAIPVGALFAQAIEAALELPASGIDILEIPLGYGGPETVDAVMADGRWLMRDGRIVAFDEAAAIAAARDTTAGLRDRIAAMLGAVAAAVPGLTHRLRRFPKEA